MLSRFSTITLVAGLLARAAEAVNFHWESIQLTARDVANFSAVAFGDASKPATAQDGECRAFPGSDDWPTDADWAALNATIDGVLLKPTPAAAVCYPGTHYDEERCRYLIRIAPSTRFYLDDPLTSLTQWVQGNTCLATLNATGTCSQGGFPSYVVNATTVKHIQAAVNFARNKNIRLVIKNTGHDFGGRSTGAGSLSVWVHHLKSFELLPNFSMGRYTGKAVRVAAGVEAWEMFNHMGANNITVVSPGGGSVGMVGGWLSVGGHGTLTSKFGLGCDQALSIQIVTADGKLVTADPTTNEDLFWALRGGGPSTYGIITSVVLKAFDPITTCSSGMDFSVNVSPPNTTEPPPFAFPNATMNGTTRGMRSSHAVADVDTFWRAISTYYRFGQTVVDAGGMVFGYIYPQGNDSYSFSSTQHMVNMTPTAVQALMQPLYDELHALGLNLTNPLPRGAGKFGRTGGRGGGDAPTQTRYRSRLFPRANWADNATWTKTVAAIRRSVEEGGPAYTFHAIMHAPTAQTAGWPGADSAVNPAWRNGILHASLMEKQGVGLTAAQARGKDALAKDLTDYWREATPGSGAYMNEGDPAEPAWQASFYGNKYPRLASIKRRVDPWGVFWAPTTVGSEAWEVQAVDGYPHSQNGRLCRASVEGSGGWSPVQGKKPPPEVVPEPEDGAGDATQGGQEGGQVGGQGGGQGSDQGGDEESGQGYDEGVGGEEGGQYGSGEEGEWDEGDEEGWGDEDDEEDGGGGWWGQGN